MDELPHRPVIDLQPTLGKFDDKTAQSEVPILDPLQQPDAVLARNRLRPMPAHLTRRNATGLALAIHPVNGRANAHPKLLRRPVTRHAPSQNGSNYPLAEIERIRLAHPCWPPSQPAW